MIEAVNAKSPDRPELPPAAVWRRLELSKSDRSCIAFLATAALVAIGFSAIRFNSDGRGVVDLRRPVARHHLQRSVVGYQVDVNRAAWPEWTLLPRIGETLARRIVDARHKHGPFSSHDDLRRVAGIGPKTLASMRPYLLPINGSPGPSASVDVNHR